MRCAEKSGIEIFFVKRVNLLATRNESDLRYNFEIIPKTFDTRNSIGLVIDVTATKYRLTITTRRSDEIDVRRPITSKTFNPLGVIKSHRNGPARARVFVSPRSWGLVRTQYRHWRVLARHTNARRYRNDERNNFARPRPPRSGSRRFLSCTVILGEKVGGIGARSTSVHSRAHSPKALEFN